MSEHSPSPREANPYAAPLAPGAAVESPWPGAVDLLYAASVFVLFYTAMCGVRWILDHELFYAALLCAAPISAETTARRYRDNTGRQPSRGFIAVVGCEAAALFFLPTFLLAHVWGFSDYPLIEAGVGTLLTFLATFTVRVTR